MSNRTEAVTRKELIDPQLEIAGWNINDSNQVGIEIPVDGFPPEAWEELRTELRKLGEVKEPFDVKLPEGISLQEPGSLGRALGQFLRQKRFSARRAVVGVPAKWLMVKEMRIPPASAESTAGILRIIASASSLAASLRGSASFALSPLISFSRL